MKPDWIVSCALLFLVMMNSGCAVLAGKKPANAPVPKPYASISEQENTLSEAREQLRKGKEPRARDLMAKVVDGAPVAGVTDEALFRLALLFLKEEGDKGIKQAQTLLERLSNEYPDSLWTRQSAPLLSHLAEDRLLRNRLRELKTLKELNLSLSRDNRELRQSLERLKKLDLELDQRIKH